MQRKSKQRSLTILNSAFARVLHKLTKSNQIKISIPLATESLESANLAKNGRSQSTDQQTVRMNDRINILFTNRLACMPRKMRFIL